jgi:hypothetical protein
MTFFLIIAIFELIIFCRWVIYPIITPSTTEWIWQLNLLENNLFYSFGLLSPSIIILSCLSFLIKPICARFITTKNYSNIKISKNEIISEKKITVLNDVNISTKFCKFLVFVQEKISRAVFSRSKSLMLVFLVAVIPSMLFSLYPYTLITDSSVVLGTDIPSYKKWLTDAVSSSNDLSSFLYNVFTIDMGTRPLSLLVIHSLSIISGQTDETILKFLPVMLGPFLVLTVYFLTHTAYGENRKLPILASILTAASHQVVIGFYAAFYANWLALITAFISIMFLLRSLHGNGSSISLVLFTIFTILTLFFHSFTWSYFIAVVVLFLTWSAISYKRAKRSLHIIIILVLITSGIIATEFIRSYYTGTHDIFTKDLSNPVTETGLGEYIKRWTNLNTTFRVYLGGFLTNFAILLLLFLWTIKANYNSNSDRIFLSMIFVSLLPILFGDFVVQSRILYNIPFQIPASLMMYRIYKNYHMPFGKILLFTIILMQFNYALRAMANMYYISPT